MEKSSLPLLSNLLRLKTFDDVDGDFFKEEVLCRLIHFWEARTHTRGNVLMGLELLLIDEKGSTIQGFISANRIGRYENNLKANSVYKLKKFIVNPSKTVYKVSDHKYGITFTNHTSFDEVIGDYELPVQHFRIRQFKDFSGIADMNGDLFNVVGQIRLITSENFDNSVPLGDGQKFETGTQKDRVFLHLFMKDGETIRVYLWDNIAVKFRTQWNQCKPNPTVLLLTAVNPKTLGGAVSLSSTASTCIFFNNDVSETREFSTWLGDDSQKAPTISSSLSAITKLETVTLNELKQFIENEIPQEASFYTFATIVDVLGQYGWNYVSCSGCNTKLEKSDTSLVCFNCKKVNTVGVLRFRFEIFVRDENNDDATFVIFDRDGINFTGTRAPELYSSKFLEGQCTNEGRNQKIPDCILDIIGRTCKFQVKVKPYDFRAIRQTFSLTCG